MALKGTDVRLRTNADENVAARHEYATGMLNLDHNVRTVFLDETGFNLWTRRSQGRALKGQAVRRIVTTQRGPNVTVCMAISAEFGLLEADVFRGGQTRQCFGEFVNRLAQRCHDADPNSSWLIVMDGPNFHRGVTLPQELQHQIRIQFLPPYSPFLNPSELANSALKAVIRQKLADPGLVEEERQGQAEMTQEEWQFMLSERFARESLPEAVSANKVARWELRCQRLFGRCLDRQHF